MDARSIARGGRHVVRMQAGVAKRLFITHIRHLQIQRNYSWVQSGYERIAGEQATEDVERGPQRTMKASSLMPQTHVAIL